MQSNNIEVEGTNSSGNLGGALNLVYQHRSLFGNAESFTLKLRGAMEAIKRQEVNQISKTLEYGAEASINFPKFLLPFTSIKIIKKYNPKTSITIAYNFQQRPDYTRKVANVSFGYNWKQDKHITHYFNLIEMNYVEIPYSSPEFDRNIRGTYLENSYTDHLVPVTSYSIVFNTQNIKKTVDFHYIKYNIESAGNILTGINSLTNSKKYDGHYELFGIQYSQYLRSDIDFRYFDVLNQGSSLAYRFFAGAAFPYGNALAVPFEKQYFSGGANSIRGWQVRTLGPGSFKDTTNTKQYPNSTGDIKLEANIEYRFKLFWILESAFFLDAGNIWTIKDSKERPGAVFKFNKFMDDLALGSGVGLRFDLKFFLFRTDLGLKMRDPSRLTDKWIFSQKKLLLRDFALCIAIAYPF
jgi:outer membrane protein assembly factor BamA